MNTYFGMRFGQSYAFVDIPHENAGVIIANIFALGWSLGGNHPLMNNPKLPPISKNCSRIWGVAWTSKRKIN